MCLITRGNEIHNQKEIEIILRTKSEEGVNLLFDAPNVCLPLKPRSFE